MRVNSCCRCLPWLLLGAALTALTLIFPKIGFLQWFTMIPIYVGVFRLCESDHFSAKKAYGYGFLTIYVYYLLLYHWFVYLYPLDFVGMDPASAVAVVAVAILGLPILQALMGGLIFVIYRAIHKTGIFDRCRMLRPFVFAALWVVFEWSSTVGWTGVPWGRLALGQIEYLPILQSASLLGSYFVAWLLLMVNGLFACVILSHKRRVLCASLAVILFVGNLAYGIIAQSVPQSCGEGLRVAVIQGNMDSHEKWSSDSNEIMQNVYGKLTRQAAAEGAQLVLWPESTIPSDLHYHSSRRAFVSNLAKECNVVLIVGAFYYERDTDEDYNALFYVEPDGTIREEFYAKRHLVPFGEYVPMRNVIMTLIPPLANLSILGDDLTAGKTDALFRSEWGSIGSLICFDSIYEQLTIDSVRAGAELMLISSNDSWFFDSAAVYQHEAQAQLRAIESGRYFVRSANTGISTVIAPDGQMQAWIDPLVEGYAVADVRMCSQNTLYVTVGNLFVWLCAGFAIVSLTFGIWLKKRGLSKRRLSCPPVTNRV